ncbi:hypothetical protein TNCV_2277881 [Trichonephila clavipes]|nr:hypothetical protein TNCV_2277881 [Trichonephila clavipes]
MRFVRPEFAQYIMLCLEEKEEMLTNECLNSIEPGSLPIDRVDYPSRILPVALVEIQPLPCKYRINGFLRIILNGMQDLHALL